VATQFVVFVGIQDTEHGILREACVRPADGLVFAQQDEAAQLGDGGAANVLADIVLDDLHQLAHVPDGLILPQALNGTLAHLAIGIGEGNVVDVLEVQLEVAFADLVEVLQQGAPPLHRDLRPVLGQAAQLLLVKSRQAVDGRRVKRAAPIDQNGQNVLKVPCFAHVSSPGYAYLMVLREVL